MNFSKLFFFLSFFAVISIQSCTIEDSSDVNQDKIYTVYELFYNSNTDKTTAVAQFRFGGPTGTILKLTKPAYALFNGDTLSFTALYSGHIKEYAGLVNNGIFEYRNVDEDVFMNDVPAFEEIAFPSDFDTLSKSKAYELSWVGTSLKENQHVGLFVGSWTWGQDALFAQNGLGAKNIILGLLGLSNLSLGNASCYMDRSTEIALIDGTSEGGKIRGKFRALNKEIVVVE
jgi:hypothetical protein